MTEKSKIFNSNRVLALISSGVPLVARFIKNRRENLFVCSTGRHLLTYSQSHLSLLSVSPAHKEDITCIAGDSYQIFSAAGKLVTAWRRGQELKHQYKCRGPVHLLLPFGILLITIDEESLLQVWYIKEEVLSLEIPFDNNSFKITAILHPNAYLNKILLGSEQGQMQLWNINTSKLIYTFKGWKTSIKILQQAPALDVVAVGLADGRVILHNLKLDQSVMELGHGGSVVTAISFRTDGHPIMVVGTETGQMILWNLEERRIASCYEMAHERAIANAVCLPNEPLVVTNSADNSLKLWIFDMPDGGARLLRLREGHSSAPTVIRFAGHENSALLSAGSDSSLRILSTAPNHHPQSLGKASYNKKISKKKKRTEIDTLIMPPVIDFSYSMQKDKQWDSVAAIHSGIKKVTTWSLDKKKMGAHKISPLYLPKGAVPTCLTVTHCGNFVCIGYSNGSILKYNMQSGQYRGKWGTEKGAHSGPVRGVETDHLNSRLITAGQDKRVKIWTFKESTLPTKILKLEDSPSFTRCHRESSLMALCNEDYSILIVDIDTINIVRKFEGHSSKINDACFSHDSRWLITTSMDCTFRTWDIPTGQLIDIFKVDSPCTSLSMSMSGDFLATIHSGLLGVYLWANRTLYVHVNLKPIELNEKNIPKIELPTSVTTASEGLEEFELMNLNDEPIYKSPEQINEDLITLSNLPTSRWQNLLNLDIIKKRNKPVEQVKVPKSAPFFLPTISNIETQFDFSDVQKNEESRHIVPLDFTSLTSFGKLLDETKNNGDFSKCISEVTTMGPSRIHFEIQSMSPSEGGTVEIMGQFLKMIKYMLESNKNFELAQSYLGLFLKSHGNFITETQTLMDFIEEIQEVQKNTWEKMQEMLLSNLSIVKAFKDMSY